MCGASSGGGEREIPTIALGVAILAGCAADFSTAISPGNAGAPPPKNFKEVVSKHVRERFFDPYSLRDTEIFEPLPVGQVFDGLTPIPHSGWMVCLKANGKNRLSAYTGLQVTGFLFENGVLSTTVGGDAHLQAAHHCRPAKYSPFDLQAKAKS
jgi:hypothetical protein